MATCFIIKVGDEECGCDVWLLRESLAGPKEAGEDLLWGERGDGELVLPTQCTGPAMGWGNPCPHMMPHALSPVPFTAASSRVPEGLCCQHKGRCPRVAREQINNQKDQLCTKQRGARVGPWQQKQE